MKFSIKDFFSKYGKIRRKLRMWSHLLENLTFFTFFQIFVRFVTMMTLSLQVCNLHTRKSFWDIFIHFSISFNFRDYLDLLDGQGGKDLQVLKEIRVPMGLKDQLVTVDVMEMMEFRDLLDLQDHKDHQEKPCQYFHHHHQ